MSSPMTPATSAGRVTIRPAGGAGPTSGRGRPDRRVRTSWRTRLELSVLTIPALVVYIGFVFVPVGLGAYYGFFRWRGIGSLEDFVGFDNYARALSDPVFLEAIKHNLLLMAGSLLIQGPIALGIALLLNRRMRGRAAFRVLVFIPYVVSEVITGVAWRLLLLPHGAIDQSMEHMGLGGMVRTWLADPDVALATVLTVITWKYLGFAMILFLAGLQGIPSELSEAAAIDGANWWQIQYRVTLPLLGPTIRIWAFLSMIGSLQLFDLVFIMTSGRAASGTNTMATYMVSFGLERGQYGYGSAVAVILFVISLVFALIYQRFVLRRDTDGALTTGVS
jgi:raffinose/stachyose/melibiose transport system permease protein